MTIANISGIHLNYEVAGQGQAVVLLHGMTGSTKDWANQIGVLSPEYKVVAIDMRGHGKSAVPKTEAEYSIPIFAEDVLGILNLLHIKKCCLVGHSVGGFIALQFALSYGERLAGLVLVNTSSGQFERNPISPYQLNQKIVDLARSQGLRAASEREGTWRQVLMASAVGYIHSTRAVAKWHLLTSRLSEIRVPTLIFWGDEDTPFAKAVKILEKGISDSSLVTVPGVGHSPHQEAHEVFNESLLKFLEKVKW